MEPTRTPTTSPVTTSASPTTNASAFHVGIIIIAVFTGCGMIMAAYYATKEILKRSDNSNTEGKSNQNI